MFWHISWYEMYATGLSTTSTVCNGCWIRSGKTRFCGANFRVLCDNYPLPTRVSLLVYSNPIRPYKAYTRSYMYGLVRAKGQSCIPGLTTDLQPYINIVHLYLTYGWLLCTCRSLCTHRSGSDQRRQAQHILHNIVQLIFQQILTFFIA